MKNSIKRWRKATEEDYIHKEYILEPGDRLGIKNNKEVRIKVEVIIKPEEVEVEE